MSQEPFFSITIPTYNRSEYLQSAIGSVLLQDFNNFEIVVSDNSSDNKSEKICKQFNDKRICYSKNKTNIGFVNNLYKVIKRARGKYIFLLGDDDIILRKNTFSRVYDLIKKKKYGYIRLKFVLRDNFNRLLSVPWNDLEKAPLKFLKKNSQDLDIYKFLQNSIFGFISGNIFKNFKNITIPELEGNTKPSFQMERFWIKFLHQAVKSGGACLNMDNIIIARWLPSSDNSHLYDVIDNKIFLEKSWELFFRDLSTKEQSNWIKEKTEGTITLLPSIKFYSDRKRLFLNIRRILQLNHNLYYQPKFYFSALIAFLMPRSLWKLLKKIYQKSKSLKDPVITKEYGLFRKELSSSFFYETSI